MLNLPLYLCKYLEFLDFNNNLTRNTVRAYSTDVLQVFQLKNKLKLVGPKIDMSPKYGVELLNNVEISMTCDDWANLALNQLRTWQGLSTKSRKRKISSLHGFVNWLRNHHKIDLEIHVEAPTGNHRKLPNFISVDECLSVLKYFKKAPASEALFQQKTLFYLLYGSGLRVSEACSLQWKDISLSQKQVRVLGKGNKERIAILPESTLNHLKGLKKEGDYVFGSNPLPTRTAYDRIKHLGQKALLLKPLHPHALRHSFATHLLSSGSDLRVLQQLLGHQSLAATELYTHLDMDHLANTMENHHPLSKK